MKRNLTKNVDGMQLGDPLPYAEKKLKDMENGSTLFYSALNGQAFFVKENDIVRHGTDEEWIEHVKKKIKGRNKLL